jgi:hypothetical protein
MDRRVRVTRYYPGPKSAPMIRLRGHWLRLAGFPQGTPVAISVQHGKLVLTSADPLIRRPAK